MSGEWVRRSLFVCAALSLCVASGCSDDGSDGAVQSDASDSDIHVSDQRCLVPDEDTPGVSVETDGQTNDGDEICDDFEANHSYNGQSCDQVSDCDNDGFDDTMEWLWRSDEHGGIGAYTDATDPDTDDDGTIDSEDPDPNEEDPCEGANAVTTECPLVETTPFEGRTLGVITGLEIADEDCCFAMLDADAAIDNSVSEFVDSLASLLASLLDEGEGEPQDLDLLEMANDQLTDLFESSDLLPVLDIATAPLDLEEGARGDAELFRYLATLDAEATFEMVRAGDASFSASLASETSLMDLVIDDGTLSGSSDGVLSSFVQLPIPQIVQAVGSDAEVEVTLEPFDLYNARLRGSIEDDTASDAPDDVQGFTTGDMELQIGGAVRVADIVAALRTESTLGLGADGANLQVELLDDEPGRLSLTCGETEVGTAAQEICSLIDPAIGSAVDVDTDDDGVLDALSVGVLARVSGAALTTFE